MLINTPTPPPRYNFVTTRFVNNNVISCALTFIILSFAFFKSVYRVILRSNLNQYSGNHNAFAVLLFCREWQYIQNIHRFKSNIFHWYHWGMWQACRYRAKATLLVIKTLAKKSYVSISAYKKHTCSWTIFLLRRWPRRLREQLKHTNNFLVGKIMKANNHRTKIAFIRGQLEKK